MFTVPSFSFFAKICFKNSLKKLISKIRFTPFICYKKVPRSAEEAKYKPRKLVKCKKMLEMSLNKRYNMTSYDHSKMCKCTQGFRKCAIVFSDTFQLFL